jgi:arylsulfatase A-like enzyme
LTGFAEGIELPTLRALDLITWNVRLSGSSIRLIWVAPLFYLVGFCALGAIFGLGSRWVPAVAAARGALFSFALLFFFDLVSATGRIAPVGAVALSAGLAAGISRSIVPHKASSVRFFRRTAPWMVLAALLAIAGIEWGFWLKERQATSHLAVPSPDAPNIIIIVVDTLRADHLSTYGYHRLTSPNIDQFAGQGALFEVAFSASAWTLPSHASILTGRLPHEHGAVISKYLDDRFRTLPQLLSERGYRTAAFSANTELFTRSFGFGRGFLHFEDRYESVGDAFIRTFYGRHLVNLWRWKLPYVDIVGRKRGPSIGSSTLAWIDAHPGKPFFVFLNYFDPHDPYLPPQPYRGRFSNLSKPGGLINSHLGREYPPLTTAQLQSEVDAYDGAIAYADEAIRELLEGLDKRNLTQNTIVVLTSDHGESFGGHGLLGHGNSLYRDQIHVPLILRWPGKIPSGIRIKAPVSNVSLGVTLLDLVGIKNQNTFTGPSLTQLWARPGETADRPLPVAELVQSPSCPAELRERSPVCSGGMVSMVSPQWQFIFHERFGPALYDWQRDPEEVQDRAKAAGSQRIVSNFMVRLHDSLGRNAVASAGPAARAQ